MTNGKTTLVGLVMDAQAVLREVVGEFEGIVGDADRFPPWRGGSIWIRRR